MKKRAHTALPRDGRPKAAETTGTYHGGSSSGRASMRAAFGKIGSGCAGLASKSDPRRRETHREESTASTPRRPKRLNRELQEEAMQDAAAMHRQDAVIVVEREGMAIRESSVVAGS